MSSSQNVDTGDLKGVRSGEASGWLGWGSQTVRPRVECHPEGGTSLAAPPASRLPSPRVRDVSKLCPPCSPQGGRPLDPERLQEAPSRGWGQGDPLPFTGSICPGPVAEGRDGSR